MGKIILDKVAQLRQENIVAKYPSIVVKGSYTDKILKLIVGLNPLEAQQAIQNYKPEIDETFYEEDALEIQKIMDVLAESILNDTKLDLSSLEIIKKWL